ncbi:MAG: peptidase, partial [Nitrosotalea sp.]
MNLGNSYLKKGFKLSLFSFLILSIMFSSLPYSAFGDGFSQENLPPASVGNRQVQLFIKLLPPIIYSNANQQPTLLFRWFDANTNQSITHVSFFLTITKHSQLLFRELLHTHTGILNIDVIPTAGPNWLVQADKEPILGGWVPDNDDDPINIQAPILGEGGLYHFNMQMFSIDYDNNIFDTTDNPQSIPNFDAWLSVGDISNHNVVYNSNTYNTTVISYYDKINDDFNFDPSKLQVSYSMPFDWNLTRISTQPIFVHEEIHIPKAFKDFTNTPTFSATMNGYQITGRRLIVDPYTLGDTVIAHILLNKLDIANMAKQMPSGTDTMNFTLAPAKPNVVTSSSVLTDFGGWGVTLGWNPTQIAANSPNNLQLSFFDAFTQQPVNGDVNYDLKILDSDGNTILSKTDLTAKNAVDTQTLNLP